MNMRDRRMPLLMLSKGGEAESQPLATEMIRRVDVKRLGVAVGLADCPEPGCPSCQQFKAALRGDLFGLDSTIIAVDVGTGANGRLRSLFLGLTSLGGGCVSGRLFACG
jgi:hypothetical protein